VDGVNAEFASERASSVHEHVSWLQICGCMLE
jgi:hypothetical protein